MKDLITRITMTQYLIGIINRSEAFDILSLYEWTDAQIVILLEHTVPSVDEVCYN